MRVTVTELKRMIAESVAKHIKEDAPPAERIQAAASRTPGSGPGDTFAMPRNSRVPPELRSATPGSSPSTSDTTTVRELRSMVREVIEEMMGYEKGNEEMYEAEKLKEAVRKMVRAELKRSGR